MFPDGGVLKAWFQANATIEGLLGHENADLVNGIIFCWVHS